MERRKLNFLTAINERKKVMNETTKTFLEMLEAEALKWGVVTGVSRHWRTLLRAILLSPNCKWGWASEADSGARFYVEMEKSGGGAGQIWVEPRERGPGPEFPASDEDRRLSLEQVIEWIGRGLTGRWAVAAPVAGIKYCHKCDVSGHSDSECSKKGKVIYAPLEQMQMERQAWEEERGRLAETLLAVTEKARDALEEKAKVVVDFCALQGEMCRELRQFCDKSQIAYKNGSDWREMLSTVFACYDGTQEGCAEAGCELDRVKEKLAATTRERDDLGKKLDDVDGAYATVRKERDFFLELKFALEADVMKLKEEVLHYKAHFTRRGETMREMKTALFEEREGKLVSGLTSAATEPRMEGAVLASERDTFAKELAEAQRIAGEALGRLDRVMSDNAKLTERLIGLAEKKNNELALKLKRLERGKGAHGKA